MAEMDENIAHLESELKESELTTTSHNLVLDTKCYILIATAILRGTSLDILLELMDRIRNLQLPLTFTTIPNTLRVLFAYTDPGLLLFPLAAAIGQLIGQPHDGCKKPWNTILGDLNAEFGAWEDEQQLQLIADHNARMDREANADLNEETGTLISERYQSFLLNLAKSEEHITSDSDLDKIMGWILEKSGQTLPDFPNEALITTARDIARECHSICKARQYNPQATDLESETRARLIRACSNLVSPSGGNIIKALEPVLLACASDQYSRAWIWGQVLPISRADAESLPRFVAAASNHHEQFDMLAPRLLSQATSFIVEVALPLCQYYANDFGPLAKWLFSLGQFLYQSDPAIKYRMWRDTLIALNRKSVPAAAYAEMVSRFVASIYYHASIDNCYSEKLLDLISEGLRACETGCKSTQSTDLDSFTCDDIGKSKLFLDSFAEFYEANENPLHPLFSSQTPFEIVTKALRIVNGCRRLYSWMHVSVIQYIGLVFNSDPEPARRTAREMLLLGQTVDSSSWRELVECAAILADAHGRSGRRLVASAVYQLLVSANLFSAVLSLLRSAEWPVDSSEFYLICVERFWNAMGESDLKTGLKIAHECQRLMKLAPGLLEGVESVETERLASLLKATDALRYYRVILDGRKDMTPIMVARYMRSFCDSPTDEQRQAVSMLVNVILSKNTRSYKGIERIEGIANNLEEFYGLDQAKKNKMNPKITCACIEAALADDNFDFAYAHAQEVASEPSAWLTVYQVGKHVSMTSDKSMDRYIKQRNVIGQAFSCVGNDQGATDALLRQWTSLNDEITKFYSEAPAREKANKVKILAEANASQGVQTVPMRRLSAASSSSSVSSSSSTLANTAGEGLQSLLISGLGWAIGANHAR